MWLKKNPSDKVYIYYIIELNTKELFIGKNDAFGRICINYIARHEINFQSLRSGHGCYMKLVRSKRRVAAAAAVTIKMVSVRMGSGDLS